jgi:DNA-binding FadR family transcriptional regulator
MKEKTEVQLFKTVKAVRLSDIIAERIGELIVRERVKPGDRLPSERELAEQFGTSRACIREALRRLEQQGMVEIRKGVRGGAFITEGDGQVVARSLRPVVKLRRIPIEQISQARLVIEPVVARWAAEQRSEELLERMAAAIRGMKAHVASKAEFESFDAEFHRCLGQAQGNPILELLAAALLEVIRDSFSGIEYGVEIRKKLAEAHTRVFKAIRQRNPKAAERAMVNLIQSVDRWLTPLKK